ncbi:MAG: S8 family serine peptidase [Candidatus Njordarchaeia archaeon]
MNRKIASVLIILVLVLSTGSLFLNGRMRDTSVNTPQVVKTSFWPSENENYVDTISKDVKFLDVDANKISDRLENKIAVKTGKIKISLILNQDTDMEKAVETFENYGGEIIKYWDSLKVIHGYIDSNMVYTLRRAMANNLVLIDTCDKVAKPLTDVSVKLIRAAPYVWNTLGFKGDPNSAIAILDTGIDDSHKMIYGYSDKAFANPNIKIVGWYDAIDGTASPFDDNGHGTHVASIAAGNIYNGDPDNDGDDDQVFEIKNYEVEQAGSFMFPIGLFVNETGYINVTLKWTASLGVSITKLTLEDIYGIERSSDSSNPFHVIYNVTDSSLFGYWTIKVVFESSTTNGYLSFQLHMEEKSDQHKYFSGVAPNTKIVAIRAMGDETQILDGLNWILNNAQAYHILVLVNSWVVIDANGYPTISADIDKAVSEIIKKGVVVVAASGNSGDLQIEYQIGSPANVDGVITVGATDDFFKLTYYSSRGPAPGSNVTKPDITAPGGLLIGQGGISAADTNDAEEYGSEILNDLIMYQGTSMAAPHVGGAVAILAQVLGGYDNWDYNPASLVDSKAFKIKMALLMTAWENYTINGWKDYSEGFGFLQVDAAVEALVNELDTLNYTIGELYSAGYRFKPHVWASKVLLQSGETYDFFLYNSKGLDSNIFLYAPKPNIYGEPVLAAYSNNTGYGVMEHIEYTPSESGYYYVVVKEAAGSGKFLLSTQPIVGEQPTLTIVQPPSMSYTNKSTITLIWNATDPIGIDQYVIYRNGTKAVEISDPHTTTWNVELPNEGIWNITIAAYNVVGNSTASTVFVVYDRTPPEISVTAPKNNSKVSTTVTIKWSITDLSGESETYLIVDNGTPIDVTGLTQKTLSLEAGNHKIVIVSTDKAGNKATTTIYIIATEGATGGITGIINEILADKTKLMIIAAAVITLLAIAVIIAKRR